MEYKAALFDFDGTITKRGVYVPDEKMQKTLTELARKVPIGFCTGRQMESLMRSGMEHLIGIVPEEDRAEVLKNIFLFAENGAMGYYFDVDKGQFEEIYRVPWPEAVFPKEDLRERLTEVIKGLGEMLHDEHKECVVMRTKFHFGDDIEYIYEYSEKIYEATTKYLAGRMPNYEDHVHVGNSGIGVIIGPADGDKNVGIRRFGEYLRDERGFEFSEHFREILAIGDRPHKGGNDHYFLNGQYGSPFTVGTYNAGWAYPKPVLDDDGVRLLHAEGTHYLLNKFFGV